MVRRPRCAPQFNRSLPCSLAIRLACRLRRGRCHLAIKPVQKILFDDRKFPKTYRSAPPEPGWQTWFWRRRVWTGRTGATPEPVSQALLQCCVTALRATVAIAILIEAPGTVLRLSGLFDADDGRDNSKNE